MGIDLFAGQGIAFGLLIVAGWGISWILSWDARRIGLLVHARVQEGRK